MKKLLIICLNFMLLCACTKGYERDTTPGEYVPITYAELQDEINNEQDMFVIFTQAGCEHCAQYKSDVLNTYLETHHVIVREFILSNEENYSQQLFTDIQNFTVTLTEDVDKQFIGTPYSIVIEDGQLKEGISGGLTEAKLEEIVTKYQLDKIKE